MFNKEVEKLYKGKDYIETIIIIRTPIVEELKTLIRSNPYGIKSMYEAIDKATENIIMDNLESDILKIDSNVKGELKNICLCYKDYKSLKED